MATINLKKYIISLLFVSMKTKFTILLLFCGIMMSCESEKTKNNDITGRWKLMEVSVGRNYQNPEKIDYSKSNIIYDFRENNKLITTGGIHDSLFIFDYFKDGEHFYEYSELNTCSTCLPSPNLKIDRPEPGQLDGVYFCSIDSDKGTMSIGIDRAINDTLVSCDKIFIKLK
jgi:hypothetical protein